VNARILRKTTDQYVVAQAIADGAHDHALMMGHIGVDRDNPGPAFLAFRRIVDCFQQTIETGIAEFDERFQIFDCFRRQDLKGKRRCIGRDDHVFCQPATQPEAGDAKGLILIAVIRVSCRIGGFGYPPWNAFLPAMFPLHFHGNPLALVEQRLRTAQHQEAWHQIFEHRTVPGNQRETAVAAHDRAAEMEPVFHRYILMGNGEIAGQPCFAGEKVVMMGIQPVGADIIADMKQASLAIIIIGKFHLLHILFGLQRHVPEVSCQFSVILPTDFNGICKRLEPAALVRMLVCCLLNCEQRLINAPVALRSLKLFGKTGEPFLKLRRNFIQRQPGSKRFDIMPHGLQLMPETIEPVVQFTQISGGNRVRLRRHPRDRLLEIG